MPDQIGNITVPDIVASGTFPIVPDYPFGRVQPSGRGDPPVRERQRQDRAALPAGHGREAVHRAARLAERRRPRVALRTSGSRSTGPTARSPTTRPTTTATAPPPTPAGSPTSLCPGRWSRTGSAASASRWSRSRLRTPPTRSHSTVTRFPSQALKDALLSQVQQMIPLIKIQPLQSRLSRHLSLRPALHRRARSCTCRAWWTSMASRRAWGTRPTTPRSPSATPTA